jgi:hypothetical protein
MHHRAPLLTSPKLPSVVSTPAPCTKPKFAFADLGEALPVRRQLLLVVGHWASELFGYMPRSPVALGGTFKVA